MYSIKESVHAAKSMRRMEFPTICFLAVFVVRSNSSSEIIEGGSTKKKENILGSTSEHWIIQMIIKCTFDPT